MKTITPQERSDLRRLLIGAGLATRGLNDQQLQEQAAQIDHPAAQPEQPAPAPRTPKTASKPAPAPAPAANDIASAISAAIAAALASVPQQQGIDEDAVKALIDQHAATPRPVNITIKDFNGTTTAKIDGAHQSMPDLIDLADLYQITSNAPLLVGPAGSGKTTAAHAVANAMGLDFYSTGAVMDKFELLGYQDANGKYRPSALFKAFTQGGVFLWDEIDASAAEALVAFNQLLANGHYTFPDGVLHAKHPDFTPIGAANTQGTGATRQYVGRTQLDGATLDRFTPLDWLYDENIETAMALSAARSVDATVDTGAITQLVSHIQAAREFAADEGLDALITPRASQQAAALYARGWPVKKVLACTACKHLSTDQQKRLEQHAGWTPSYISNHQPAATKAA